MPPSTLSPGTLLGPYEIVAFLGAGGMGEVYRATDTNLKRQVAIKVLPQAVQADPDRLARFQREAEVLAAINHPNIAQVFGQEKSGGATALVMELVEGPTLADRIAEVRTRGTGLPITEALTIAKQIADALEAAHERGIIHRDLKPANIKVRPDGTVKALDFGLAKAMELPGASDPAAAASPTVSDHGTEAGVVMGTAAYMSPEQAAGRTTDRRTDLWAFGVVLFEMLTARQMFDGETSWHIRAAVLTKAPDWSELPVETPASIRRLLRRCVEKDRKLRLADAGAAGLEIAEALAGTVAEPASTVTTAPPASRRAILPAIALAVGAIAGTLATWALTRPAPSQVMSFGVVPPAALALSIHGADRDIAISPDGTHMAYRAGAGQGQLAVRRQDQLEAHLLPGITPARAPFFSPDGRWIGFFDLGELKKVSTDGGPAIALATFNAAARGATWADENTIILATADPATGLLSVPANGGEPTVLTRAAATEREGDHLFPSALPGGRGVLFTITARPVENSQVAVLDLNTGQRKTLIRGGSQAQYVETGHLLYASKGSLQAVRFDLAGLEVVGDPATVVNQVMMSSLSGAANYAVSRTGTLVYVPGGADRQEAARDLVWVDRQGGEEPITAAPLPYTIPRLAPDGTRLALDIRDQEFDIWTWDLALQRMTRLTFDPGLDVQPAWSPDSRRIVFSSAREDASNLYWRAADGSGADARLTTSANPQVASSVTPDGTYILGSEVFPKTGNDVVRFAWGGGRPSEPLVQTAFQEYNAEISPDGRYFAYQSDESGQFEVYVRPYPNVNDGRWQVSSGGGRMPAWAPNGRELFFIDAGNTLMGVPTQTAGPTFSAGQPAKVFNTKYALPTTARTYDVSRDGRRFLMIKSRTAGDSPAPVRMAVVLNWFEALKRILPER